MLIINKMKRFVITATPTGTVNVICRASLRLTQLKALRSA